MSGHNKMLDKRTESTHLHSHSVYGRYDGKAPLESVVVSTGECYDNHLPARSLSNNNAGNGTVEEKNYASKATLGANIILLIIKLVLSYVSGSLAFVASAVDSLLDLVSQTIIFCALRGNERVDTRIYPLGRSRLEPVGIVVVASLMGMASLQVVMESLIRIGQGLDKNKKVTKPKVDSIAVFIMLFTIATKVILYFICRRLAKHSASMSALAQDHLNDVMSNSVAIIAAGLAANHNTLWFLDPVGAILISAFIVLNWIEMAREQTDKLVGRAAEPEFVSRVEAIIKDHDERMSLDIIRAYYFGHRFLVEIEVVMPDTTTLRVAHDVALSLQQKVEELEEVERCHVHVDYDFRTEPEHKANFEALQDTDDEV